jgi:hypothetical protein
MESERRTTLRIPIIQEVMLSHESGFRLGKIVDISMTGALLDIYWGALSNGVPADLMITLRYGEEDKVYRIPSTVARVTGKGTAIEFKRITQEVETALSDLLVHGIRHADDNKPGKGPAVKIKI